MTEQKQTTARRSEEIIERYLAATSTIAEANVLDELVKALNEESQPALTPANIERLAHKYRTAATSVGRGNRLNQLAGVADDTANAPLKRWLLDAVEASTGADDQSLRITVLETFRWLTFPDEAYRYRAIDWVLSRLDATDHGPEEPTYAISTCTMWVRIPRVRDKLLGIACDESKPEDIRLLALDCFSVLKPGEAPAEVLDACRRFCGDHALGRTAAYVLERCTV